MSKKPEPPEPDTKESIEKALAKKKKDPNALWPPEPDHRIDGKIWWG